MADTGKVKFKDGSTVTIDMSAYDSWSPDDFQTGVKAQIDGVAKTRGIPIMVDIPGYSGNLTEDAERDFINIRNPAPPFHETAITIDPEALKSKVEMAAPMIGGAAEFFPNPISAVSKGAGLLARGARGILGGAPTRAGVGAAAGSKVGDMYLRTHGITPTDKSAVGTGMVAAGGEALFRLPFAARRFVQRVFTAGAKAPLARANRKLLEDVGVYQPRLDQILRDTGESHALHESLYNWAARNFAGSKILRDAANQSRRDIGNMFEQMWVVRRGQHELTPTVVMAGQKFGRGVEKFEEGWREVGNKHYAELFDTLESNAPPGIPTEWAATKTFLEGRASLDPLRGALASDKMKGLHSAFETYHTKTFKKNLVDGSPVAITREQPVDFQDMKALRTQVGELIGQFEPDANLPKKQLQGLYNALTEDMEAAAKKYGAEAEYIRANQFWSKHKDFQEGVINNITKKVSNEKMGHAIQSLVRSGDYQNLGNIKGALGPRSNEWEFVENYVVRELGQKDGNFNIGAFYNNYNKLSEGSKRVLVGTGEKRVLLDKYVEAVDKWGKTFAENNRTMLARFTQAEVLGPGALAFGAGAAAHQDWKDGVPYGIVTVALAMTAPKYVAKLLVDPEYTKWALKSFEAGTPEKFAGMVSRLGAQYATAPPDQQMAISDFLYNISLATPVADKGKGGAPGLLGGSAPRGLIGGQ